MKGVPDAPQCGFSNAVVQIMNLHGVDNYRLLHLQIDIFHLYSVYSVFSERCELFLLFSIWPLSNFISSLYFSAHNVLADQELREGIKEFSDWPTIPQVRTVCVVLVERVYSSLVL